MINPGLSASEFEAYTRRLLMSHTAVYQISLLDLEHRVVRSLSDRFVGGQLTYNYEGDETTRKAEITILDHDRSLGFDSKGDGSLATMTGARMIRVHHVAFIPEFDRWVACPMFTGPITRLFRNGPIVDLQCSGKEHLLGKVWSRAGTVGRKNSLKDDAVRKILVEGGETKIELPKHPKARLPANKTLVRNDNRWGQARSLVNSMSEYLYYDSWGTVKSRPHADDAPVFTFRDGDGGSLATDPTVDYDFSKMHNSIRGVGRKPKKGSTPTHTENLPAYHPSSAQTLQRNGYLHWRGREEENSDLRTKSEVTKYVKDLAREEQDDALDVRFNSPVIPFLEPNDPCRVVSKTTNLSFRYTKSTIPLQPGGLMVVGFNRNLKVVKQ